MFKEKAKTVRLIYGIVFILMSLVVAVLLILQVSDIYFNGGASPYTVANIKQHFNAILPALCVWIALMIGGFIIWEVFPIKTKMGANDIKYTFARFKKQLDGKIKEESEESSLFQKSQLITYIVKFVCGVAIGICTAFSLAYLCNSANFTNVNQNKEVEKAALYLLPFVVASFALSIGVVVFERVIVKKQLPMVKKMIKTATAEGDSRNKYEIIRDKITAFFDCKHTVLGLRLAVAVVGTVLFIYGLATGGAAGVLAKAVTICRQCIGLG